MMSPEATSPAGGEMLLCEVTDHVARLTLNRPERMNALSVELRRRLVAAMSTLGRDPNVRVIVISGAGGKAFSSGADLKDIDSDAQQGIALSTPMIGADANVFESVMEVPKPTIAAIDGYALAGGLELALACDMRIASRTSVFGMPEAKIGMGANFASVLLPRLVPRTVAFEILYTGTRFTSEQAFEWGLLNRVVDAADLVAEVDALATVVSENAPLTIARYKQMLLKGWELPVPAALRLNAGPNPYDSQDRVEGIRAFLESRRPKWTGT